MLEFHHKFPRCIENVTDCVFCSQLIRKKDDSLVQIVKEELLKNEAASITADRDFKIEFRVSYFLCD